MDNDEKISTQLNALIEELRVLNRSVIPKRKSPSIFARQTLFRVAQMRRNGYCPCCEEAQITNENGEPTAEAEIDHWFSRDRSGVEEMWPVCPRCNDRLRDTSYKAVKQSMFSAFQQTVRMFVAKEQQQATLFK